MALGAAGPLTVVFAFLALLLYNRTEAGVVRKHSQDQQLLSQLAAIALEQRVDGHVHAVESLSATLRQIPEEKWEQALAAPSGVPPGSNVFLLRPDGALQTLDPPRGLESLRDAVRPWLGAREAVLTSPFPLGAPDCEIALLVPLLSEGRVLAQLGLTFPFTPLVEIIFSHSSAPAHLGVSLLDEQGNILANTRHPEMVRRQVPDSGQRCLPCHTSFALERRMLEGEAGVDRLQVDSDSVALLAFTPVQVPGRRWSLSLSEPYSAIIADTRQGFRAIILLLGLVLLVAIIATIVTLQYRVQHRRAEERAQLAERQATLEREQRQTEQLTAIGKMTSQIAHQINTPLAALGLNVAYLQEEIAHRLEEADGQIDEVCKEIAVEIERLKHVVNDYLRFSRVPQTVLAVTSLQAAVKNFLDFIEPEARDRHVRLETDLNQDPAYVQLDVELFRQAFLNLVRNSFEAMPTGGILRIRLHNDGSHVALRLEDTGRGIPPDVQAHIFDPFFTTKKDGTGLGLVHARRIVEQHSGTLRCESEPGRGTTLVIRLPAAPTPTKVSEEEFTLTEKG